MTKAGKTLYTHKILIFDNLNGRLESIVTAVYNKDLQSVLSWGWKGTT